MNRGVYIAPVFNIIHNASPGIHRYILRLPTYHIPHRIKHMQIIMSWGCEVFLIELCTYTYLDIKQQINKYTHIYIHIYIYIYMSRIISGSSAIRRNMLWHPFRIPCHKSAYAWYDFRTRAMSGLCLAYIAHGAYREYIYIYIYMYIGSKIQNTAKSRTPKFSYRCFCLSHMAL